MAKLEGQKLVFDLSEAEAKIAEKTLPLLSAMLDMLVKFEVRLVFHMALMGKEKWRELWQRIEQGEDPEIISQEFFEAIGGPESLRAMAENLAKDFEFPGLDEIEQMFD